MKNQLKYFILIFGLFCGLNLFSQGGVDCASATPAMRGGNLVDLSNAMNFQNICGWGTEANVAKWFTYTHTGASTHIRITTCLQDSDTRVSILSGSCDNLVCVTTGDDECTMSEGLPDNFATDISFLATTGTTYYLQFDDRWSGQDRFHFDLSILCPTSGQYIGDWCFSPPGHIVSDNCFCVPYAAPTGCIIPNFPADGATDVPVVGQSNVVGFNWWWDTYQPVDEFDIYLSKINEPLVAYNADFEYIDIGLAGLQLATTYQWKVVPKNAAGSATNCPIYTFSTPGAPPYCTALEQFPGELCAGGVVSNDCNCVPISTPDCPTLNSPANFETDVIMDAANNNSVTLTWTLNGFQPEDEVNLYAGQTPNTMIPVGTGLAGTQGAIIGSFVPGVWFWTVRPANAVGEASGCDVFTFSTVGAPAVDCPNLLLNVGDLCVDGIVSDACACVPLSVPSCPTLITPANATTEVVIDEGDNNKVYFEWSLNGFQPEDEVSIYIGNSPTTLTLNATGGPGSSSAFIDSFTPGTYYWTVVPSNALGDASGCDIYEFTTEGVFDCQLLALNFGDFCQETGVANGYVDENCDCISVAPLCPTLISPADGAIITLNDNLLTWNAASSGAPTFAYWVFFGLSGAPLNFYTQLDGNVESLQLAPADLVEGETYSWFLLPLNENFEATDCATSAFTFTVAVSDCGLGVNIGDPCDDGDGNTFNDAVQADCSCVGSAENATCEDAIEITPGIYPGNMINGGGGAAPACFGNADASNALWYKFTVPNNCLDNVTISSSIDLDQPDTRLMVYSGTCESLSCVLADDDGGAGFTSLITFPMTQGTYYLMWDDRWADLEFDFEFTITEPGPIDPCPTDFNSDGTTNGVDFSSFLGNFGLTCTDPCNCPSDLNKNGIINGEDFSLFLGNFGLDCE